MINLNKVTEHLLQRVHEKRTKDNDKPFLVTVGGGPSNTQP
jgi:hypothetical protein